MDFGIWQLVIGFVAALILTAVAELIIWLIKRHRFNREITRLVESTREEGLL